MVEPYPAIDKRRAKNLAKELDRSSKLILPELREVNDEHGPSRAIFEIAARLAGQVTQRLDKTPKRDVLAFFQALDTAQQAPVSASTILTFKLADNRDTAVFASSRIQVAAEPPEDDDNSEEIIFETQSTLNIVPAQLTYVVVVDPVSNRIEEPPPQFFLTEAHQQTGPYQVHAFSNSGSQTVQIFPAVGLEKGDVIEIEKLNYRISMVEDGLITLNEEDLLAHDVLPGTKVTKVIDFNLFQGRNIQRHACYIGDADLLNLEQEATIQLIFSPKSVASLLANSNAIFELFSANENDDEKAEPDWYSLKLNSSETGQLELYKNWPGQVEETEVHGQKNRWLRISLDSSLIELDMSSQLINSLTLKVESVQSVAINNNEEPIE